MGAIGTNFYYVADDYIWVRIPKNASSSIMTKTMHHERVLVNKEDVDFGSKFTFCFVRNPFDRLLSCWNSRIREHGKLDNNRNLLLKTNFPDFVRAVCNIPDDQADQHFRSQSWFTFNNGEFIVDYVGRVETINKDWRDVSKKIGVGEKLKHIKRSRYKGQGYKHYYTSKLVDLVAERYENDLKNFNYTYE